MALAPTLPGWVRAQSWPERDLRLVVPTPAGGAVDAFARALADGLRPALGRAVIIDNRPGAGGMVGLKAVSGAPADGYTLIYLNAGHVTLQALQPGRLDLLKEFRMIGRMSHSPFALAVRADSPYKTAQELIAAVRAQPGKLSYGSGGVGSPAHLAIELIEERVGNFKALHVPFKGAIESANAIVGGQVDFTVSLLGSMMALAQGGKLRLLAVTSKDRLAVLPNVPTLSESGLSGFAFEPWGALAVAAATPEVAVGRLEQLLPSVLALPALRELAQKNASIIEHHDGKAFTAQLARDIPVEQALVKRLDMKFE